MQRFIVTDRKPVFVYERKGIWLIAEDSGFFGFYKYDPPGHSWRAFGGREFDIPLKNGSIEKAYGQWWDYMPPDHNGLLIETGYGTPEELSKCNVFCSVRVDPLLIDKWLAKNEPSNNYHRYDKRHKDFGKHKIGE